MKVGELCRRLSVPYRHVRYVLEEGLLPRGVKVSPDRGHHRDLEPAQAFWLGMVLRLKTSGVKTPLAVRMADFARSAMQGMTQLSWEPRFAPLHGEFKTSYQWFVDVGDLKVVPLGTTANPSGSEQLHYFDWHPLKGKQAPVKVTPVVILRIDLAELARPLSDETSRSTAEIASLSSDPSYAA